MTKPQQTFLVDDAEMDFQELMYSLRANQQAGPEPPAEPFRVKLAAAKLAYKRQKLIGEQQQQSSGDAASAAAASIGAPPPLCPFEEFVPTVAGVEALYSAIGARLKHAASVLSSLPNSDEVLAAKYSLLISANQFAQDPLMLSAAVKEVEPALVACAPHLLPMHENQDIEALIMSAAADDAQAACEQQQQQQQSTVSAPMDHILPLPAVPELQPEPAMEVDLHQPAPLALIKPIARRPSVPPAAPAAHVPKRRTVSRVDREIARAGGRVKRSPAASSSSSSSVAPAKRPLYDVYALEDDDDNMYPAGSLPCLDSPLIDLPIEMFEHMVRFLDGKALAELAKTSRTMRLAATQADPRKLSVLTLSPRAAISTGPCMRLLLDRFPLVNAIRVDLPTSMRINSWWRPIRDFIHVALAKNPEMAVILRGARLYGTDEAEMPTPAVGVRNLLIDRPPDAAHTSYGCVASIIDLSALADLGMRGRVPVGRPTQHHPEIVSFGDHPLTFLKRVVLLPDIEETLANTPLAWAGYQKFSDSFRLSQHTLVLPPSISVEFGVSIINELSRTDHCIYEICNRKLAVIIVSMLQIKTMGVDTAFYDIPCRFALRNCATGELRTMTNVRTREHMMREINSFWPPKEVEAAAEDEGTD